MAGRVGRHRVLQDAVAGRLRRTQRREGLAAVAAAALVAGDVELPTRERMQATRSNSSVKRRRFEGRR